MLTSSPWVTANNPLAYAREGAQLGLQARGQDLTKHDAVANRLRFAYDALAQRQWQARQNSADRAVALAATVANKGYNEDALENYRQQQIQARQDQLAEAKEKTSSAADALKSAHEDTAKFVADAGTMGAAKALSLHPNADKTVVNHVMALEATKAKQPKTETDKAYVDFAPEGSPFKLMHVGLSDPVLNKVGGANAAALGTNYVGRLNAPIAAPVVSPIGTNAPVRVKDKKTGKIFKYKGNAADVPTDQYDILTQ